MSRLEDRHFAAVIWIAKNVPGRLVGILALIGWPGVGLSVPIVFRFDTGLLINANLYGTMFAASLVIACLIVQLQARDRRHLVEWSSDLRVLDAAGLAPSSGNPSIPSRAARANAVFGKGAVGLQECPERETPG